VNNCTLVIKATIITTHVSGQLKILIYENMFIFTVDMDSDTDLRLYTGISRALALLLTLSNHHRSEEQGQPTGAQALEEVEAETQPQPQPVEEGDVGQTLEGATDMGSEEKQAKERREVPKDVASSDVGEEEVARTEKIGENIWLGLTRSLEKVVEECAEHKTERVLPKAEEGTSSHLPKVHIISYSQP
jgi:hypothetical protein